MDGKWLERAVDGAAVAALVAANETPLVSRLLALRGISAATKEEYFNPSLQRLADPFTLPGIDKAAEIILDAAAARKKIVVFGDYDCDGVCATAIMVRTINALCPAASVAAFIPERLTEGYGMSRMAVDRMLLQNPDVNLIVTVDTGITAAAFVRELKGRGIEVVVTDHHLPTEELPEADAVVNPKVAAPDDLQFLCGAGVAFMLANALVVSARRRGMFAGCSLAGPMLVMAGLATVTDIMPLVGQNRIIVSEALRRFHALAPIGLRELHAHAARAVADRMSVRDFGFLIGPRINAAGRMASCMETLQLVMCDDREKARELAIKVDLRNAERRNAESEMSDMAMRKIIDGAPVQVIDLPGGHPGVVGIVAARIMGKLRVPAPVFVSVGSHGSARAPDGYNLCAAMNEAADLLETYGGHAVAGGFSVKEGCINALRERLAEHFKNTHGEPESRPLSFDAWVEPQDLTFELADALARMEPFGECNEEPVFAIRRVFIAEARSLGQDGRHISLNFTNPAIPRAVWWSGADHVDIGELRDRKSRPFDIMFKLQVSDFGERHLELNVCDIRMTPQA